MSLTSLGERDERKSMLEEKLRLFPFLTFLIDQKKFKISIVFVLKERSKIGIFCTT